AAAAHARASGGDAKPDAARGPWRITLDGPVFIPFMEHSRRTDLRETLYRAFVTRASTGELDNLPVIERILAARQEQARLLDRASHAEVSLAAKMAPSIAAVEQLLGELRDAAMPKARAELDELTAFARAQTKAPGLALSLWDIAFWAERLRESRYAYTDEELRPYFPFQRVLDGLFAIAERLFGVRVRAADGEAPVWDPSVRFFRIADERGVDIAAFHLDPFSRPANKRGGAWMDNAIDRKVAAGGRVRIPIAYLVCNQTPPVGTTPSLMTFREVETLFHEFGHGLQHMLTTVEHVEAAGINNVEWDAVELPSQFMENWCYHWPTVRGLTGHWQSGEPLPKTLFDKIVAARTYRAGSATLRHVYLSAIDLELHHRYEPGTGVLDLQRRVAAANTILPPLAEDRFLCAFSHIFAGGYAAGYYSYKWAEVLSADAFSAFEEAGLENAEMLATTGRRFRDTVLALGGSRHPLEVFRSFRGREPSTRPLLKQTGLA
ncbi:MAG: M3 family metallopeptidase, partial [Planctomycetes bacterium]|nr:M3 family metallopeptidase [Planctomycetota bacterium]